MRKRSRGDKERKGRESNSKTKQEIPKIATSKYVIKYFIKDERY